MSKTIVRMVLCSFRPSLTLAGFLKDVKRKNRCKEVYKEKMYVKNLES